MLRRASHGGLEQLKTAVALAPDSAEARANLNMPWN
jgi:hypothetical protein